MASHFITGTSGKDGRKGLIWQSPWDSTGSHTAAVFTASRNGTTKHSGSRKKAPRGATDSGEIGCMCSNAVAPISQQALLLRQPQNSTTERISSPEARVPAARNAMSVSEDFLLLGRPGSFRPVERSRSQCRY